MTSHLRVRHEDVELWTLPMFHCNGWGGVYALTGMGGTHVVLRTIDAKRIFGLTETAPLLTVNRPDHGTRRDDWPRRARAGLPGIGVDILLLDDNDQPVAR